jgi:hypothetical protein
MMMAVAPPPPSPPHEVAEVNVRPLTPPPVLVASYPAEGETTAPGVLILKLTFDQRMTATGFDITTATGAEAPPCVKTPRLLNDGKTFVLLCTVLPGRSYDLAFNARPDAEGGFQNLSERRAKPVTLSFKTTVGEPVRNLDEAMRRQNLTRLDVPIQESPRR